MKIQAIIPAAGVGVRLESKIPKPFVELLGRPLFVYAAEAVAQSSLIESVIIVGHPDAVDELKAISTKESLEKIKKIVAGGKTRCESVRKGIEALDDDTDIVVIHDGARPLIKTELIDEAVRTCEKAGAVITAVSVKPTIKRVKKKEVIETLDRNELWEVQTPQVFKKSILLKAHQQAKDSSACDDAFLVEQSGVKVKVIEGDYRNIKVTTKEDLIIAEALLKLKG